MISSLPYPHLFNFFANSRYRQREGGVVKSILKDSQVVLSTCHSSGGRQMANQEFDVVIIDEATQAIEAVSKNIKPLHS